MEGLHNLGIKGEHQGKLLRLPVNAVDDSYALDIRHPAIMVSPVKKHYYFGPDQLCSCFFPSLCTCTRCELLDQSSGYYSSLEPARNLPQNTDFFGMLAKQSYQIKNLQAFILAPLAILIL